MQIYSHVEKELKNRTSSIPKLVAWSLYRIYGYTPELARLASQIENNIKALYEIFSLASYSPGLPYGTALIKD
ncbi:hypothetical protein HS5_14080 [Acidianus sp. HS-5]|nr:hypothetical protein HS5_14080 [Acidianus sp. HS-5]